MTAGFVCRAGSLSVHVLHRGRSASSGDQPDTGQASALVTSDAQHQVRLGKQEKDLSDYKLYVAERYASNEYLSETKREILESIRDLARRIEHP